VWEGEGRKGKREEGWGQRVRVGLENRDQGDRGEGVDK
jgi:hypothetical protein